MCPRHTGWGVTAEIQTLAAWLQSQTTGQLHRPPGEVKLAALPGTFPVVPSPCLASWEAICNLQAAAHTWHMSTHWPQRQEPNASSATAMF